ncbi:hypothetical protein Plhal304r1_c031g0099631 [Plasmopara halstedii]
MHDLSSKVRMYSSGTLCESIKCRASCRRFKHFLTQSPLTAREGNASGWYLIGELPT